MPGQFRGDFTRDAFEPFKHFCRVLMQQGRVQLDADWNEQAAILLHRMHTLAKDLIGPSGASGDGFLIGQMLDHSGNPASLGDFLIHWGDFYVDGILCELNAGSIPIAIDPQNSNQVLLPTPVLDGAGFQQGQYIVIYDAAAPSGKSLIVAASNLGTDGKSLNVGTNVLTALGGSNPFDLRLRRATTFTTQPDFPSAGFGDTKKASAFLAYLDVWERHISWIEDESILEVALGGPDTASRSKVVCQIKITNQAPNHEPIPSEFSGPSGAAAGKKWLGTNWPHYPLLWQSPNRGWLIAQTSPRAETNTNACIISPSAQYRGAENQLYRVEVHTGGSVGSSTLPAAASSQVPTFKWSREDGSAIYKVLRINTSSGAGSPTTDVQLANLGRDARFGLNVGDWVELVNDDYTLLNMADPLLQIESINVLAMTITLAGATDPKITADPSKHPLLRRWDHKQMDPATTGVQWNSVDNAIKIVEASGSPGTPWIDLEDGIQIQFEPAPGGPNTLNIYRTGDYWLIPARTANGGEVLWPTDASGNALAQQPHGVTHHYAPLAFVGVNANGLVAGPPTDCRRVITQVAT